MHAEFGKNLREAERERIKLALRVLGENGVSLNKVALMLEQPYNTVKYWAQTGGVESYYAGRIDQLVRIYCPSPLGVCQIEPQVSYCEISHIST